MVTVSAANNGTRRGANEPRSSCSNNCSNALCGDPTDCLRCFPCGLAPRTHQSERVRRLQVSTRSNPPEIAGARKFVT